MSKTRKRVLMVMFDSLNRHLLGPYGATEVPTPNFDRLAKRAITFDHSYVCSMPCMPARRELHTGRPNFLHTSWCPIEPYDDSVPQILKQNGIHTHISTDHYHYWEDGGATYLGRYSTYDMIRGQEGDTWKGHVADPTIPANINGKSRREDWVNRLHTNKDALHPQTLTFDAGLEFLRQNHEEDKWLLQIECFDPHEPFFLSDDSRFKPCKDGEEPLFDWPGYQPVTESPDEIARCRRNYTALVQKCDESLGRILDFMDQHSMWEDTMLAVCTDHGFLLGEHGAWAKNWPCMFEEIAHTPFFLWDPHCTRQGERRTALVQPSLDLGPTFLDYFGLERTPHMTARSLLPVCRENTSIRETAIFGYFGDRVNITDGRYVYFRAPRPAAEVELNHYRLVPTQMRGFFSMDALAAATLHDGFNFTKGAKVLRIPVQHLAENGHLVEKFKYLGEHVLFDLKTDPQQQTPITDPATEARLCQAIRNHLVSCEAPPEQYSRLGLG